MPAVSFIPYFPDRGIDTTLGDFRICNWQNNRQIADGDTRSFLDRYFGQFRTVKGEAETRIAIVYRRDQDPFAELEDFSEVSRFTDALMAAYLFGLPTDRNHPVCSSDNFIGLYQTFNPHRDAPNVAFTFGSYFRMMVAGSWNYLQFVTPQFVPDMECAPVEMIQAHLAALCSSGEERVVRLFRSLEWLKLTFTNYEGLQHDARPVAMCTAFETLLDFPEQAKSRYFSDEVNRLVPPNKLPKLPRAGKAFDDTAVGWWCREFYDLRSRITHGERIQISDLKTTTGQEHLRIALTLFDECICGLLVEWGLLAQQDRVMEFVWRSHLCDQLGIDMNAFI